MSFGLVDARFIFLLATLSIILLVVIVVLIVTSESSLLKCEQIVSFIVVCQPFSLSMSVAGVDLPCQQYHATIRLMAQ